MTFPARIRIASVSSRPSSYNATVRLLVRRNQANSAAKIDP
jgi:hypothetical protein